MFQKIISAFPAHVHPLTLVSDLDRLLAGEVILGELVKREFHVIQEDDPIILRHRVEVLSTFSVQHPLIIITTGILENLPYDLYQPANRLVFSLHQFFPNLAYPVLQTLSPDQIEKLGTRISPSEALSRGKSIDYILRVLFSADPTSLNQPHAFINWLNNYHQEQSPFPELLRTSFVNRLKRFAVYDKWDIDLLIRNSQAFSNFVQNQWQYSIDKAISGNQIREPSSGYCLSFGNDLNLQELVPTLVRRGNLQPLEINDQIKLPDWATPGVIRVDPRVHRYELLLNEIENDLKVIRSEQPDQPEWVEWKKIAQDWSELCNLHYQSDFNFHPGTKMKYNQLINEVDEIFINWLKNKYSLLGVQRLPKPHHVFHIPHYLAYLRNQQKIERIVLLILDGMSLANWRMIEHVWKERHVNWEMKTELLLAQIPTITSISRYALISGLRPADIENHLGHTINEAHAWSLFWSREGVSKSACQYLSLAVDRRDDQIPELENPQVNFWCLIENIPDELAHNATLGTADQHSSLKLWLESTNDQNSNPLEKIIDCFLERGFSVFITSDHGHVEAVGFGQPSEGLIAQTRGKRARIYNDHLSALRVQTSFPDTILWENDGVLPDMLSVLMPSKRNAFTLNGDVVVTHGGISIDEIIVPLVQITKGIINE